MYLALAKRRGIPWDRLRGSIQNDITLEEVVRSGPEYIPPEDCFRIQCDNIEFIRQEVPLWNFMTVNGYNLREFGTSAVSEMAVALINAVETLETLKERGHDPAWLSRRMAFFWSIGNDFFEEEARIRAVRRLWQRIMKYRFDAEEREQTIILSKLQQQLKYAYTHSGLYRKKWDAVGVKPEDIRSLDDFEAIPILTKDELRADQAEHPPFGSNLCVSYKELARVHGTSGTTGKPTAFGISKDDIQRIAETHARVMWAMGIRPEDIVFIGSFFSLYWGSWGAMLGTERLGATAFPFGAGVPGQTDRAIEWMVKVKPTVFYGTPSYSLYIAEKAKQRGIDPARDFNFRRLFFSGEPGARGCTCGRMWSMPSWWTRKPKSACLTVRKA